MRQGTHKVNISDKNNPDIRKEHTKHAEIPKADQPSKSSRGSVIQWLLCICGQGCDLRSLLNSLLNKRTFPEISVVVHMYYHVVVHMYYHGVLSNINILLVTQTMSWLENVQNEQSVRTAT